VIVAAAMRIIGKIYPENPTVLPASAKVNATEGSQLISDPFEG
jgi:hypothetical protein